MKSWEGGAAGGRERHTNRQTDRGTVSWDKTERDGLMGQDIGLGQHLELQQQAESVGGNPV